jgi:mannose-6-phosphate isomerase-like protein (cupin superfamily)
LIASSEEESTMAKCQVFTVDQALTEVVADGLYMKTLLGNSLSVAVVKFVEMAGVGLPAKAHSHGEEVSLQLAGGCSIFAEDATLADREVVMNAGDAVVIPAGLSHFGVNRFGIEGLSMRLNVVSPPRREYQTGDKKPFYPLADQAMKGGGAKP